jgi:glycosyltransferase involved in cell wall biosynthesis
VLWVQGWQVAGYWQGIRQARNSGIEIWMRGETNASSNQGGGLRSLRRLSVRKLLKDVDRFLYIVAANKEFYKAMGARSSQLASAPYCVDNKRFAEQAARARPFREQIRRDWGIPANAFCVAFCGKFIPKKRPLDLTEAASALQARLPNRRVHLLWIGSGTLGAQLRQSGSIVFDSELPNSVVDTAWAVSGANRQSTSFVGFLNQTEISRAYVAADCMVLPSDENETWGLVVNEAMASGLPCIVSDGCGCADDLVRPTRPDLVFHCGDIRGLVNSLLSVLHDPPHPSELRRTVDAYDYLRTVETAEELYNSH